MRFFCRHKWSDWFEVKNHLERECFKCGKTEAKFPNPLSLAIKLGGELLLKYLRYKELELKTLNNARRR